MSDNTLSEINGSLLIDIEIAMKEYAKELIHYTAGEAAKHFHAGEPIANATFKIFNEVETH